MSRYLLAEHVHLCRIDPHIFVLDVRNDAYRALPAARTDCLGALVEGWPVRGQESHSRSDIQGTALLVAQELVRRGILCTDPTPGKSAAPVKSKPVVAQLSCDESGSVGIRDIAFILWSHYNATITFKRASLEQLIRVVKQRRLVRGMNRATFDSQLASRLVVGHRRLRPFLYTSRDHCLFETFVLLELLSRYQLFPVWAFGIRASPFAAHCWLQWQQIVLDDSLEHIRQFTPIMIV